MNQEFRNSEIQRARAELALGRPVTAWWKTPHSNGHITRVVLTELHHSTCIWCRSTPAMRRASSAVSTFACRASASFSRE
jgi:hypothetical protein